MKGGKYSFRYAFWEFIKGFEHCKISIYFNVRMFERNKFASAKRKTKNKEI
jgi:hypothetical protein